MYYVALIAMKESKSDQFANALSQESGKASSVYVVGMTDANALAQALIDGQLEVEVEMTSEEALKYAYVEAIGTVDSHNNLPGLIALAKERIKQIDAKARSVTSRATR